MNPIQDMETPARYPERFEVESALKKFLVVGPGYYGIGPTINDARKRCMKAGCKAKENMVAFGGTDDLGITDAGYISATWMIRIGEI